MLEKDSIFMLQVFFWGMSAITGITAGWFTMRGTGQTTPEKEATKEQYRQRWQQIRDRKLLQLPEGVISGFLDWKRSLPGQSLKLFNWLIKSRLNLGGGSLPGWVLPSSDFNMF